MSGRGGRREEERREASARSFVATIVCGLGILLSVSVGIYTLVAGGSFGIISAAAVGVGLGILGYLLGANRLGTATIVISVVALFLGLAATSGLIPGIEASDRSLPDNEPRGQN